MCGIVRWILASTTQAVVTQVVQKKPRLGVFIFSLPILSMTAIVLKWRQNQDLATTSKFDRVRLLLVPVGILFFILLAFADRLGLNFWPASGFEMPFASFTVGTWLWLGPKQTQNINKKAFFVRRNTTPKH
jgi:hypothetical protein